MSARISPRWLVGAISAVGTVLLLLVGWQLAVWLGGGSSYLIKGPVDVIGYLFTDGSGSGSPESRRAALLPMIGVTLAHAGIGLALGGGLALLGSIAISLSRLARTAVLPFALALQTVPLIALAPVIYAIFGAGTLTAAVIAGIVTFFPLLMNVGTGLGSASPETVDLVHALGGGRLQLLLRVQLPSALPYVFAGLRIAAPATISAATLYEFLFSFEGLGAQLLTSKSYSNYDLLWTLVVVTILLALCVYGVTTLVERLVLAGRFPPTSTIARTERP